MFSWMILVCRLFSVKFNFLNFNNNVFVDDLARWLFSVKFNFFNVFVDDLAHWLFSVKFNFLNVFVDDLGL